MEASFTEGSEKEVSCLQTRKATGTQHCPLKSLGKCLKLHCILLGTNPSAMEPVLNTLDFA